MANHASIFYITPQNRYVLCYDEDLESLPMPHRSEFNKVYNRLSMKTGSENLMKLYETNKQSSNRYVMRIRYKPEKTEFIRDSLGYVDRIVACDNAWLINMMTQFKDTYPTGLPTELIRTWLKSHTTS